MVIESLKFFEEKIKNPIISGDQKLENSRLQWNVKLSI